MPSAREVSSPIHWKGFVPTYLCAPGRPQRHLSEGKGKAGEGGALLDEVGGVGAAALTQTDEAGVGVSDVDVAIGGLVVVVQRVSNPLVVQALHLHASAGR